MEDTDLAERMLGCFTLIRRVLDDRLRPHGVSVARKRVLGVLEHGAVRQNVLATVLDLAPRTITELVDGLERDGFVSRTTDPGDRRARLVDLTPTGRQVNDLALRTRQAVVAEMFADLSNAQRTALAEAMSVLNTRLTTMSEDR